MDNQNKNLILATALSFLVVLGWFMLFPPEEPPVGTVPRDPGPSDSVPAAPDLAALPPCRRYPCRRAGGQPVECGS